MPHVRWMFRICPLAILLIASSVRAQPCGTDGILPFHSEVLPASTGITQVLAGNFDADFLPDLVLVSGATGHIETRRQVSRSAFTSVASWTWSTPVERAVVADLDLDGRLDLAFTDDSSRVVLYRGLGDGTFTFVKTVPIGVPVFDLVVTDLNNGGGPDLVVSCPASRRLTTLVNTSGGFAYTPVNSSLGSQIPDPRFLACGRIDGDPIPDLMVSRGANGAIFMLIGTGTGPGGTGTTGSGSFSLGGYSLPGQSPLTSMELLDIDSDGDLDLLFGEPDVVRIGLGSAGSFALPSAVSLPGASVSDFCVGGLMGDLFCACPGTSTVQCLLASTVFRSGPSYTVGTSPRSLAPLTFGSRYSGFAIATPGSAGVGLLVPACEATVSPPGPAMSVDFLPPPALPDPGPTPAVARWPSEGLVVCNAPGDQSGIAGTDDFAHGAYFAWIDGRNGMEEVYATRIGPDGQRVAAWPENGFPVCTGEGARQSVSCLTDGHWGVWVLWLDSRGGGAALYVQKLTATGEVAPGWPVNGRMVCTASSTGPVLSYQAWADLFGGLRLGWKGRVGSQSFLFAQHLGPDGLPMTTWPACGLAGDVDTTCLSFDCGGSACSSILQYDFLWPEGLIDSRYLRTVQCRYPETPCLCDEVDRTAIHGITGSGTEWTALTSEQVRAGYDPIGSYYLQGLDGIERVGRYGHPSWIVSTSSTSILPTPSGQYFLLLPNDPYDVRRLEDDGTYAAAFGTGRPLCDPPCVPTDRPELTEDGSGGLFVVWSDARGGLYATSYGSNGVRNAGWAASGLAVTSVAANEGRRCIVGDHRGSIIVAWSDRRNGESDLFARRLTGTTVLPARAHGFVAPDAASRTPSTDRLFLLGMRPNPVVGKASVEFGLSRAGNARLSVLDVAGRVVARRDLQGLAAGPHHVDLAPAGGLAAGIYLVELRAEHRILTVKAVVTR